MATKMERLALRSLSLGEHHQAIRCGCGGDAGFTLIELMVVLLILAILLAIAIPTFLGVTGGANDRAAQSNTNTALTTVKTAATQNNQSYSGLTAAGMKTNEPSLTWSQAFTGTAASVSTQGPVDFFIDALNRNGVVIVSYSKNSAACWYAVDNLQAISNAANNGPYTGTQVGGTNGTGAATQAPTNAGTFYGKGTATAGGGCDPSKAPVGAAWGSSFSAA